MIFDGSTGTFLHRKGLSGGEIPEIWNFTHPDDVKSVPASYLAAGADVVSTNTFGANRFKLNDAGLDVAETVNAAVSIAKSAVAECGREAYVALSVGSLGKLLAPVGELPFEEAVDAFAETVTAGEKAGADLILFETMSDPYEMKAALLAAKENTSLPVIVTMMPGSDDRLFTGGEMFDAAIMLQSMGVDGIGFNCGDGPDRFLKLLPEFMRHATVPVLCSANAGLPHDVNGHAVFDIGAEEFASKAASMVSLGVSAVGGCCGTDDTHIKAISYLKNENIVPHETDLRTIVTSRSRAVFFGEKPLVIGERINPTGKPLFKVALKNRDFEYILREGVNEEKNGADILDVNVGLPGIDEASTLEKAVTTLQSVTELPLQIDTSDPVSLERALRVYNGKALVNSVNGTEKSMSTVFPLVKKYGGAVVCLAMDENGIPETAEERLGVIEKIVERAAGYGISENDLVADALVTTQAVSQSAASVTLETVKLIKEKLGIPTVLGVSNISFGLPNRERINAAFFGMALEAGLSGGIVNPSSELLMFVYNNYVKNGYDGQLGLYTRLSAEEKKNTVKGKTESLKDAVMSGLSAVSAEITTRLLAEKEPLDVINGELIPALDEIGRGFESGKIYLPQLLNASDAAKASFDVIKSAYRTEKTGDNKIILATVKGDIHDIGKNIVKVLLENYGFDVIDLGKNVPPEDVLDAVTESGAKLVGLSALMTTTVASMAETIKLLNEKAPSVKVMVGGAVLNAEYASSIGADFYGKDAVASVKYAREFFGV